MKQSPSLTPAKQCYALANPNDANGYDKPYDLRSKNNWLTVTCSMAVSITTIKLSLRIKTCFI